MFRIWNFLGRCCIHSRSIVDVVVIVAVSFRWHFWDVRTKIPFTLSAWQTQPVQCDALLYYQIEDAIRFPPNAKKTFFFFCNFLIAIFSSLSIFQFIIIERCMASMDRSGQFAFGRESWILRDWDRSNDVHNILFDGRVSYGTTKHRMVKFIYSQNECISLSH